MEVNSQTHSDEDGFIEQVWWSLKEVQEERLPKGKYRDLTEMFWRFGAYKINVTVINQDFSNSPKLQNICMKSEITKDFRQWWIILVYLIKDRVVAFSDAGPLALPGYRYLDNRLDVDARQLSALDDPHTNLDRKTYER